jgi:hypothetical protein
MDVIEANPAYTAQYGLRGVVNTSNTTPVTGEFYAIQIMTPTVFSALSEEQATGAFLTGTEISPTWIHGDFTGYTLTSGFVRAHRK